MHRYEHLDKRPSLEAVHEQFQQWRQTRKRRKPIPEKLWHAAVQLVGQHSVHRVSKTLRLNYTELKRRIEEKAKRKEGALFLEKSGFVELDVNEAISPRIEWTTEMETTAGTKIKITCRGSKGDDLVHVARVFVEKVR